MFHSIAEQPTTNLTQAQFLMWLGQQINPTAPLYNMIFAFEIRGVLDIDRFARAFDQLVHESDSLRTVVHMQDGAAIATWNTPASSYLHHVDFTHTSNPDRAYQEWLSTRRIQCLDLSQQLFDSALVRLAADRSIWYLNIHHLVTDAAAMVLIYRRMVALYQGSDRAAPAQFASYAAEEREHRTTAAFATATGFWRQHLAETQPALTFYGTELRQRSPRTERIACALGPERSARLRELADSAGIRSLSADISRFTLFASALIVYLHRVSGNSQIALGAPFHNRTTQDQRETIGLLIEVCPLSVAISSEDTFATLAARTRAELFNVMRYAQPGVSTAELNRSYEALLNYLPFSFEPFAGHATHVEWVHSGYGDSNHSIRLQVHDFDATGEYTLHFDLNTSTFSVTQYEQVVAQFMRVFDAMLADIHQPIGAFPIASMQEIEQTVNAFNSSDSPYPSDQSVTQLIAKQVARTPEATAIVDGDRVLSYCELDVQSNYLAWRLQQAALQPGQLVAICMDRSAEAVVAILAVLKAGGAYVPLDPSYPPERLAYMLREIAISSPAMPPIVLIQPGQQLQLPQTSMRVIEVQLDQQIPLIASIDLQTHANDLAYCIFTSGSTGKPKGALITQRGLVNYLWWACEQYTDRTPLRFPLFSSLSFDLTVTSIFVPLISGGSIIVYPEADGTRGLSVLQVFDDDAVDIVKLTPAHLALVAQQIGTTQIRRLIVGGEEFKTELARSVSAACGDQIAIWNEYGPTETVVGCMIHRFDPKHDRGRAVPIGIPAANAQIYVLHGLQQPVPPGVIGEMYIGGDGVARGYLNRTELTAQRFLPDPFHPGTSLYRTGDLARWSEQGQLEFLGRADDQIKLGGYRIELGEIEAQLQAHPAIYEATVHLWQAASQAKLEDIQYCVRCGLASNYPGTSFDHAGVCTVCRSYDGYRERAQSYFHPPAALTAIVARIKAQRTGSHDAIVLLSGGKDSTYMLYQLVEMGLHVLAFTLDNGFISEEAKANIRRVVQGLGVDHVFGSTPAMNAIFVESLQQHANVCNGCFKTVYTLSSQLARERGIRAIFTGLSRGQFFETRLTEDVFRQRDFNPSLLDSAVLEARKAYHRREDAVSRSLDVDLFRSDRLFEDLEFVDFYRYCDVGLDQMYAYLAERAPWVRPSDTGRSTNCLINEAGIYVHTRVRGYHNYALPYSWDVRMGHKTRDAALEELDDSIDIARVEGMLAQIGYTLPAPSVVPSPRLVAYYTSDPQVSSADLRAWLAQRMPEYMLPAAFVALEQLPLTTNGKLDRRALPAPESTRVLATALVAPQTSVQHRLVALWAEVLGIEQIGIQDDFFQLGGTSLPALRLIAMVGDAFRVTLPVQRFFAQPTIVALALVVEELLVEALSEMSDEAAAQLLAALE